MTSYTQKAIERAVSVGYVDPRPKATTTVKEDFEKNAILNSIMKTTYNPIVFMSPLFWQALGKAEGWGKSIIDGKEWKTGRDGYKNVWQSYWHDLIDALSQGKTIEEFFGELLGTNQE